jgi:hypothetical protein
MELPPASPIDPVDHEAPESVVYTAAPGCVPTAMHSVADGHETSSSALADGGDTAPAHPLAFGAERLLPVPPVCGPVVITPVLVVVPPAYGEEDDPQAERARLNAARPLTADAQVTRLPRSPVLRLHSCPRDRLIDPPFVIYCFARAGQILPRSRSGLRLRRISARQPPDLAGVDTGTPVLDDGHYYRSPAPRRITVFGAGKRTRRPSTCANGFALWHLKTTRHCKT